MKNKVILFLEEYARSLTEQVTALLEREERDGDEDAGAEAKELEKKISDIRRIVSYLTVRGTFRN